MTPPSSLRDFASVFVTLTLLGSFAPNALAEGPDPTPIYWSSKDNKVLLGDFVSATETKVTIRKSDGIEVSISWERLSTESFILQTLLFEDGKAVLKELAEMRYQWRLLDWQMNGAAIKGYFVGVNYEYEGNERKGATIIIRREDQGRRIKA